MLLCYLKPENLDVSALLESSHPDYNYKEHHIYHFLNLLYEIPSKNKKIFEDPLYRDEGWVSIVAQKFDSDIGTRGKYRKVIEWLIGVGVIEENSYFNPEKKKSKSYRYTQNYVRKLPVAHCIDVKKKKEQNNIDQIALRKYNFLYRSLSSSNLEIDIDRGVQIINQLYPITVGNKSMSKRVICMARFLYFVNRKLWFRQDDYGRLHTNLSTLKSELRTTLRYKGEKLVEIDIANSQPYFSIEVLRIELGIRNGQDWEEVLSEKYEDYSDILFYVNLCEDGQIYEHQFMIEMLNKYTSVSKGMVYDEAKKYIKKRFMKLLFSENSSFAGINKMFAREFPNVWEIFTSIKGDEYTELAHRLQQMESKMILDKVSKKFNRKYPMAPLYTIHDCIATYEKHQSELRELIKHECFKEIGKVPMLKSENWY